MHELAQLLTAPRPLVWWHGHADQLQATIGHGEFARFEAVGPDRFTTLQERFSRLCDRLPAHTCGVRAFVSAAFSPDSQTPSVLIVPRIQWQFTGDSVRCIDLTAMTVDADCGHPRPEPSPQPPATGQVPTSAPWLTPADFERGVAEATARIERGDLAKTVLARDAVVALNGAVPLAELLTSLHATYPQCWTFHVDGLVGASPERLVRVENSRVSSRALAGSAPVTGDIDVDDAAANDLLTSAKDQSEHAYAARSIVEVLRAIADVDVSPTHLVRLPTIMHLATDVTGELRTPHSATEIAGMLHPSAAICGTPRAEAARVLAELEGFDRGRYSGPVGWVNDCGDGEFVIALRCGLIEPGIHGEQIRLFAGAGIVSGSDPARERCETETKMLPMRNALASVLSASGEGI